MSEPNIPVEVALELPPEMEGGVFGEFAVVWHTQTTFVLDFAAAKQPPQLITDAESGAQKGVMPTRVVARVRIPPSQAFEVARALTQQLTAWEIETGQRPPESDTDGQLPSL